MSLTTLAIVTSLLSLVLATAAFLRAGCARRARPILDRVQRELTNLSTKQRELLDSAAASLADAYDQSRRHLTSARELLREQAEEAVDCLEQHAGVAQRHLERLTQCVEQGARSAKAATAQAARRTQRALAHRVWRLEARATLLLAESKAHRARAAVVSQDYVVAERLLDEAAELVRRAGDRLRFDPHYHLTLERIARASRDALISLRAHAEYTLGELDQLLAESERLVQELESEERQAEDRESRPARQPEPARATEHPTLESVAA